MPVHRWWRFDPTLFVRGTTCCCGSLDAHSVIGSSSDSQSVPFDATSLLVNRRKRRETGAHNQG